jgi:hypothetical protein
MGRHAAADDVDDEALASEPARAAAHRADIEPIEAPAVPEAQPAARRSRKKDGT